MTDKVQKIREEIEIVINRRLNLLNGDQFDLNKEVDGFTNEIMNIIDSLQEESVSEDLEEAAYHNCIDRLSKESIEDFKAGAKWQKEKEYTCYEEAFEDGAKWQKEHMMIKAINAHCFGFQGAALFSFKLPADNYLVGSEVKVIVIKED